MNEDRIGGNWKQFKGKVKEKWGDLTDDDMTVVEGKRDQLVGKIQERYGYEKDRAEKEVKEWEDSNKYQIGRARSEENTCELPKI
uniref:CsbD family protein n=1 Tax=Enterobacter agglomerans TaxID=549 RepID=UPI00165437E5